MQAQSQHETQAPHSLLEPSSARDPCGGRGAQTDLVFERILQDDPCAAHLISLRNAAPASGFEQLRGISPCLLRVRLAKPSSTDAIEHTYLYTKLYLDILQISADRP
jgi:hypothetical protein